MRVKLVQHLLILLLAIGIAATSEIINTDRSSRNIGMEEHDNGGTAHYRLENILSHLDQARDQVQSVLATAHGTTSHVIEGVKMWSQNPQRQTNIQQTLQGVNKLKTQAVKAFSIAEEQVFAIEWDHLPEKAKDYIREHPYQTALSTRPYPYLLKAPSLPQGTMTAPTTFSGSIGAAQVTGPVDPGNSPQQLSSPPATTATTQRRSTRTKRANAPATPKPAVTRKVKQEKPASTPVTPTTPATTRKRGRAAAKQEESQDELPHNLGKLVTPPEEDDSALKKDEGPSPKKRKTRTPKVQALDTETAEGLTAKAATATDDSPIKTPKKKGKKGNNYGITPGVSPYPDYHHPTSEECYDVVRLLEAEHGPHRRPNSMPIPSLMVSGCGEVPDILDAIIRTVLSASTSGRNSNAAFQGLVKAFGTLEEGVGKGSVDYNKVRLASQTEVFNAIKAGGLANAKSKNIKAILDLVYNENQARRKAHADPATDPPGAEKESLVAKEEEIEKADNNVLSLDHLHLLDTWDVFFHLTDYPAVGAKTAACVLLFCMQRDCFAVDTHVFRMCQYLGWVPPTTKKGEPKVDRDTTFNHCDALIPNELKYPLHQLFIVHGKKCPRCRAVTGTGSADWDKGCVLEKLVMRHGAKKGGAAVSSAKKGGKKKAKVAEHEESELSELSELESEDDHVDVKSSVKTRSKRATTTKRAAGNVNRKAAGKEGKPKDVKSGKGAKKAKAQVDDGDDVDEYESSEISELESEYEESEH
ncbi:hypothetical protein LTR66_002483 [Elasticomyces elasticus]|nr:hypothetical protein LTR66_002483 [Elasticomyces elasticus]